MLMVGAGLDDGCYLLLDVDGGAGLDDDGYLQLGVDGVWVLVLETKMGTFSWVLV